jgi:hypothetical protein
MAGIKKSKSLKIVWNKTDIAHILGATYYELNNFIPQSLKEEIGWNQKNVRFRDIEVMKVLRYFRATLNDAELRALLYPYGVN